MNLHTLSEKDLRAIVDRPEHFEPEVVEAARRKLEGKAFIYQPDSSNIPEDDKKSKPDQSGCFGAIGLIIFIIVCVRGCDPFNWFSSPTRITESTQKEIKTVSSIGDLVPVTKDGWFGFVAESDLKKISEYIVAKDDEAFKKAMMVLLMSDMAISLQKGDMVYVVDRSVWKGTIKIRKKGELSEYWTFKEVIE